MEALTPMTVVMNGDSMASGDCSEVEMKIEPQQPSLHAPLPPPPPPIIGTNINMNIISNNKSDEVLVEVRISIPSYVSHGKF